MATLATIAVLVGTLVALALWWSERSRRTVAEREVRALAAALDLAREDAASREAASIGLEPSHQATPSLELRASMEISALPTRPARPPPALAAQIAAPVPTGPASALSLLITYENAAGETSRRRIALREVRSESHGLYLVAHCYQAQAERTFRADRISEMVDLGSGEVVADPPSFLASFIDATDIVTVGHNSVMNRARPGLKALVWIARADGPPSTDDIVLLARFVSERAAISGSAPADFDEGIAKRWIADARPIFDEAKSALGRMRRGGAEWSLVARFADELVADPAGPREKRRTRLLS